MYFCKQPARETQTTLLKGTVHPKKGPFCHLLTLMLFQ